MRYVKTGMVAIIIGLLVLIPMRFPSAESIDQQKGLRTLTDEEVCAKYGWCRKEKKSLPIYALSPDADSSSGG